MQMDAFYALVLQEAPKPDGEEQQGAPSWTFWVPLVLMFVIIYFMMIRPTRRQQRQRDAMLQTIKKNDKVLTTGGIMGIVHKVTDKEVILTVDEKKDVRLTMSRSAIAGLVKKSGSPEEAELEETIEDGLLETKTNLFVFAAQFSF